MDNLLFKFDQATDLDQRDPNQLRLSALYKNNDKLSKKQQQRRNEILSNRMSKRDKLIASIRKLVSDVASGDEERENNLTSVQSPPSSSSEYNQTVDVTLDVDYDDEDGDGTFMDTGSRLDVPTDGGASSMPVTSACNLSNKKSPNKPSPQDRKFRNKAMLSEWLVDRPMNFESEWVLKSTPVGKRCLIFARKGETVAYSRTGRFVKAFQSALPGGSIVHISHSRRQFAIVDCIYVQHTNTFYLMDALAWNEHKLYESEASFRFYWLQSRYNENQEKFLTVSSKNECRFYCLKTYSASNQDILTALNNDSLIKEHNLQLDGLLFFHIGGPYVPGANPLVLWIKPDMVHRVLNLDAN